MQITRQPKTKQYALELPRQDCLLVFVDTGVIYRRHWHLCSTLIQR